MADYIEREAVLTAIRERCAPCGEGIEAIKSIPTVEAVPVDAIQSWLYEIAMNNVGVVLDGDFSVACEEIIARLDGLRRYSRERKDGADNG